MKTTRKAIGQILKEKGFITQEQLDKALEQQKMLSARLGDVIIKMGFANAEHITNCLAEQFDYKVVDPLAIAIPDDVINIIKKDIVKQYNIIPIARQNGLLIVATSDPLDINTQENLRFILDYDIECVLATSDNIENAIKKYYEKNTELMLGDICNDLKGLALKASQNSHFGAEGLDDSESPIVRLVMHIFKEAVKTRTSDIHIEPLSTNINIRFRIDGVCHDMHTITKNVHEALVCRIKILSNMDITETRKPQDGRISVNVEGKQTDIRVSTIPSTCGESITMRLLDKSSSLIQLNNVGLSEHNHRHVKELLSRPNGIILITGPTGSGKTTTLYAAINEINPKQYKIITVEDPIEYDLRGINQCEVKEKVGLTFSKILRSMLRQDPNVIVVGEIRDIETAEIAVSTSLTGHLVLSTLHTNDAPSAITRLTEMGIKPFLLSASINAILAQRLVRVICPSCKVPQNMEKESLNDLGFTTEDFDGSLSFHGQGCNYCNNTGYFGRVGIFEFLSLTPELREAIHRKVPTNELRKIAHSEGMTTLKEDGLRLVRAGITTLEEIKRVSND
ncbi:MAG: Flp pilus assembly complex ATPase component TadA [Candidatus Scalindua sp.]|nr:Flp pilus assembly complex ATPase component TadA [Candidatus Scalindua sp.]